MEFKNTKLLIFRSTKTDRPRPSVFVTGPPGVGKTLLLAEMAVKLSGGTPKDVLVVEFPLDEEGAETLRDRDFPWVTVGSMAALDELYNQFLVQKPSAVIMDNLPAAWWMAFLSRCPDGMMVEDHGKTWNKLFSDIAYLVITRFKSKPWVKFFGASSLVWAAEDAFTLAQDSAAKGPKIEKLQATLPGQLKGNVYGLFSYAVNIKLVNVQGKDMRCLQTQPTNSVVAKVRAPISERPKASIIYDLGDPKYDINFVLRELHLSVSEGSVVPETSTVKES